MVEFSQVDKIQLLLGLLSSKSVVTLLDDAQLDTLALWKSDLRGSSLTNGEDVGETSCENVSTAITNVNDVERSRVALTVNERSDSTNVGTLGDHNEVTNCKRNVSNLLSGGQVNLDGIMDFDCWVSESNGTTIMSDQEWDCTSLSSDSWDPADGCLTSSENLDDAAELPVCLILLDAVQNETSLSVVQKTELLVGSWNRDDILETGRVVQVSANLVVDVYEFTSNDHDGFSSGQRIFQSVSQDE